MIDEEARRRLAYPGGGEEKAHEKPELDIGNPEGLAKKRKERRQRELKKVADEMRRADEADDASITSEAPG
jgi:hypothetical protein